MLELLPTALAVLLPTKPPTLLPFALTVALE